MIIHKEEGKIQEERNYPEKSDPFPPVEQTFQMKWNNIPGAAQWIIPGLKAWLKLNYYSR